MNMLIDGMWTGGVEGKVDEIRNPATGETIDTAPRGAVSDVDRAVAAAQRGKLRIAALPAHERCAILMRVADAIERERTRSPACSLRKTARRGARHSAKSGRPSASGAATPKRPNAYSARSRRWNSVPGLKRSLAITMRQPLEVSPRSRPSTIRPNCGRTKRRERWPPATLSSPSRRRRVR